MMNFHFVLVEIVMVNKHCDMDEQLSERNSFNICCKKPSSCKKGTPKGDKLYTTLVSRRRLKASAQLKKATIYDTALLTLLFICGHQSTERYFIYCILKTLNKPTKPMLQSRRCNYIDSFPSQPYSLVTSLCFPAVGADTRYCQLGIHRGIHTCLYALRTRNVVYSLMNLGSLPVPHQFKIHSHYYCNH